MTSTFIIRQDFGTALELFGHASRFGCPLHGRLGVGPGRVLMTVLNLDSIREGTFLVSGSDPLTP